MKRKIIDKGVIPKNILKEIAKEPEPTKAEMDALYKKIGYTPPKSKKKKK